MKKALNMFKVAILAIAIASTSFAFADTYVKGYQRSDGTYVQGHYRSSPNATKRDNYSTWGNVNPYTNERGYQYKECGLYSVNC